MGRKLKKVALGLLCLVAAFSYCGGLYAQSIADMDMPAFDQLKQQYEAKTRTDPFAGGASAASDLAVEDLQLTGIVFRDSLHAYALISGYLVRPGDRIAGYRVDAIEKDKVILRRVDDVLALVLGGGI